MGGAVGHRLLAMEGRHIQKPSLIIGNGRLPSRNCREYMSCDPVQTLKSDIPFGKPTARAGRQGAGQRPDDATQKIRGAWKHYVSNPTLLAYTASNGRDLLRTMRAGQYGDRKFTLALDHPKVSGELILEPVSLRAKGVTHWSCAT